MFRRCWSLQSTMCKNYVHCRCCTASHSVNQKIHRCEAGTTDVASVLLNPARPFLTTRSLRSRPFLTNRPIIKFVSPTEAVEAMHEYALCALCNYLLEFRCCPDREDWFEGSPLQLATARSHSEHSPARAISQHEQAQGAYSMVGDASGRRHRSNNCWLLRGGV